MGFVALVVEAEVAVLAAGRIGAQRRYPDATLSPRHSFGPLVGSFGLFVRFREEAGGPLPARSGGYGGWAVAAVDAVAVWAGHRGGAVGVQPVQVTSVSVTLWRASLITYVTSPKPPNSARRTYRSSVGERPQRVGWILDHGSHGGNQGVQRHRWEAAKLPEYPLAQLSSVDHRRRTRAAARRSLQPGMASSAGVVRATSSRTVRNSS